MGCLGRPISRDDANRLVVGSMVEMNPDLDLNLGKYLCVELGPTGLGLSQIPYIT